jgi:hypothetical protein
MPPTPHNDLHPTAGDDTQKEGREESHRDLCVKHCHSLVKHWSCVSDISRKERRVTAPLPYGSDQITAAARCAEAD